MVPKKFYKWTPMIFWKPQYVIAKYDKNTKQYLPTREYLNRETGLMEMIACSDATTALIFPNIVAAINCTQVILRNCYNSSHEFEIYEWVAKRKVWKLIEKHKWSEYTGWPS